MAEKVKDTIDIAAPVGKIFDAATDFESYPEWSPIFKNVEIKERDDDGRPITVWFEVDAKLKILQYTLAYDYSNAPESFSWDLVDGEVKELSGSYSFDGFEGVTDVTYEVAIDPGFRVPGLLKRRAEKQIVRTALEDLKKRVESSS